MGDLMDFREPNQVKWVGARPGHNGTQVLAGVRTAVLNWTILYTVPAGKTLFLTHTFLSSSNAISSTILMAVYDTTPVLWQYLLGNYSQTNTSTPPTIANYWPPIEIPTGYTVQIYQVIDCGLMGTIHGWEE